MKHLWVIRIAALAGLVAAGVVFARWEPPPRPGSRLFGGDRHSREMQAVRTLVREHRYDEAIDALVVLTADSRRRIDAWSLLGRAYQRRGQPGDDERAMQAFVRTNEIATDRAARYPSASRFHELGWLRARSGLPDAQAAFVRAVALHKKAAARGEGGNEAVWGYNLACYQALAGEREEAVAAFVRAVELGYRDAAHARRDDDLDSIRDDPRFRAAMNAITTEEFR